MLSNYLFSYFVKQHISKQFSSSCTLSTYILQDQYRLIKHAHQPVSIRAGEVGTEVHGLDRGLRLLAWPIWAAAPLVQARRASPFLSAMSVILPYLAPLLLFLETNTEAKGAGAGARGEAVALS